MIGGNGENQKYGHNIGRCMDMRKVSAALSILLAAASFAAGVWGRDGAMIAMSSFAVLFSVLSAKYCSGTVYRCSLIMSATVLICTVIMVTAASYSTLVGGGAMSDNQWTAVCAAVQGAAAMPLIIMFYFTSAAVFGASYNWVLVSGLGWLVGMGIQVPKNVLVFAVQLADLEHGVVTNNSIVIIMLIDLAVFLAFSLVLYSVFRKNRYLITAKGLEVMH